MNPHRKIARFAATALVTVAYVALSAASVGCGGGDDDSGSSSTTVVAAFTPDPPATPADGSIALMPGATSGAAVNVRVTVTQMASFFGAAFRIKYDGTALLFNGMDNSTSFLRNGVTDSSQLFFFSDAANSPGEIVITATRVFPAVAVPVTATSDLVILNFVARRPIAPLAVEGRLDFGDPKQACDGTVAAPGCGSITVTAWKGGGVAAQ
jgi:hypothetical protein